MTVVIVQPACEQVGPACCWDHQASGLAGEQGPKGSQGHSSTRLLP